MMYSAFKLNKQGDSIQPYHTHLANNHKQYKISACITKTHCCTPEINTTLLIN